jgi:hypothetical protein
MSGTYNTMEFNIPRSAAIASTQELSVNPAQGQGTTCPGVPCGNPLNLNNGSSGVFGIRKRVIGTGEMVAEVALAANGDALGYAFWGVGNLAGQSPAVRYLTVDGVDPINFGYVDGTLPTCTAPCPGIASFANVASGGYPIWTILRVVTFAHTPAGVTALLAKAQNQAVNTYPDFLPVSSMGVVRSHYKQSNVFGNNATGSPCNTTAEAGGDVGGAVLSIQGDHEYCAATGTKAGRTGLKQ